MKQKAICIHIDEELIRIVDDLVASIKNCDPGHMSRPTMHMRDAMVKYENYKREYNVL